MTHPDHADVYARDVFVSGFGARHLARFLDVACENQPQDGFAAAEIGAGTGGLTRQVSAGPPSSSFDIALLCMQALSVAFSQL